MTPASERKAVGLLSKVCAAAANLGARLGPALGPRGRSRGLRRLACAVSLGPSVFTVACVGGCRHEPPAAAGNPKTPRPSLPGSQAGSGDGAVRVGNSDPSGAGNQPDWDAMAAKLRVRVGPRLPTDLPSEARVACTQMLDAAKTFYTNTEAAPTRRQQRLDELAASRQVDLDACTAHTSVSAAACVTVLLGDRDAEFPWLLDQCMRAYPNDA